MKNKAAKFSLRSLLLYLLVCCLVVLTAEPAFKLPPPEKISLPNGLTVFYWPNPELPLVSFRLLIAGAGTAYEPAALDGLANFTADMLLKGAGKLSAEEIAEAVDFMGASFDLSASEEYVTGSGECLSEHFPRLLQMAADCLTSPWFKEEEFTKERARRIDQIRAIKDYPDRAVRYYFLKSYFGSHPLGHLPSGTELSLAKITLHDIKTFYGQNYRPERTWLAVVGQIERKNLIQLLQQTLGRWPAGRAAATSLALPPLPQPAAKKVILVDKPDATQAYFILRVLILFKIVSSNSGVEITS